MTRRALGFLRRESKDSERQWTRYIKRPYESPIFLRFAFGETEKNGGEGLGSDRKPVSCVLDRDRPAEKQVNFETKSAWWRCPTR